MVEVLDLPGVELEVLEVLELLDKDTTEEVVYLLLLLMAAVEEEALEASVNQHLMIQVLEMEDQVLFLV